MAGKFGAWSLWVFGLVAAAVAPAMAAATTGAPAAPPGVETIQAVRVDAPPVIDGNLDDPCWKAATCFRDFWRCERDVPATEPTEAYVCYGREAIYAAFRCHDSQPDKICAAERRRNGYVLADDRVMFGIHTEATGTDWYWFRVTPLGTQSESFPGGRAPKIEWRGDWTAAVQRTPEGWQAEMAIPFSILRYRKSGPPWRIFPQRFLAREHERDVYPHSCNTLDDARAPRWVGLDLPEPVVRPLFMSYVAAHAGAGQGKQVWGGLDIKHTFADGLTAAATFNPDFENVEQVVESISYTYVERYLPEVRPFLLEGDEWFGRPAIRGYFGYGLGSLWYSRRIGDIDAGAKVFGRLGSDTLAALDAEKLNGSHSLIAAYQHDFTPRSNARFTVTDRSGDGLGHNLAYGVSSVREWPSGDGGYALWMQAEQSRTAGPGGDGGDLCFGASQHRRAGHVGWAWSYQRSSAGYLPALGYFPDQGNSVRGHSLILRYTDAYLHGPLQEAGLDLGGNYYVNGEGGIYRRGINPDLWIDFRNGWSTEFGWDLLARYKTDDESGPYLWIGWDQKHIKRRGGLLLAGGRRASSPYRYASLRQTLPLSRDWSVGINAEYVDHRPPGGDGCNYQLTLTTSYDLTDEKSVSLRALKRRAGGANVFASYRQAMRRGMDMYVLLGDPGTEATGLKQRVAVKIVTAM
jgi:hypothetical protein